VRRAGLRVRADVSVVGYDDSWLLNRTDPPLTTIRQPIESLVSQMESLSARPETLLFEPELVVRGSTGPAPPMIMKTYLPRPKTLHDHEYRPLFLRTGRGCSSRSRLALWHLHAGPDQPARPTGTGPRWPPTA
jgi:hypothetical protein